jgi:hypothetical protein
MVAALTDAKRAETVPSLAGLDEEQLVDAVVERSPNATA